MPDMAGNCDVQQSVSNLRRLLPQVVAASACNLLLFDLSAVGSFSTIVIGELHNSTGPISLDDNMASWLGSVLYICQPVAALLSGVLTEVLGRKKVMLLINMPFLLGWILTCTANSFIMLLLSGIVHGITFGLVEAPMCTYVGEVSQPEIRGVLGSAGGIFYQLGGLFVLLLGTLTDWRTTAGISTTIPVITAFILIMVPEPPIWLLSRGRKKEAQTSLSWLRGWVEPSAVQREYDELVKHYEATKKGIVNVGFLDESVTNIPENVSNPTPQIVNSHESRTDQVQACDPESLSRMKALFEPSTRRPLMLIVVLMFLITWSGYIALKPFMVTVFDKFKLPLGSHWST
ncbi:hypothetical protein L9F63_014335, partial [Diploptera punctata]